MAYKNDNLISPSGMTRAVNCPYSVYVGRELPNLPPQPYAEEGTLAHSVAEKYVAETFNLKLPTDLNESLVTEDMHKHGKAYAEKLKEVLSVYKEVKLEKEYKVTYKDGLLGGTCDFLGLVDSHLYIIDYKYGRGIQVSVVENLQLIAYALCFDKMYQKETGKQIDIFTFGIYQPRNRDGDNTNPYSTVTYSRPEIEHFFEEIGSTISLIETACNESNPNILACNKGYWCRFCKAEKVCKANLGDEPLPIFQKAIDKKQDTKKNTYSTKELKNILTFEELSFLALNKARLVAFIEGAHDLALDYLKEGKEIKGLEIKEDKPSRKFIDDKDKLIEGLKALGIKEPVKLVEKVITITDAERELGAKIPEELLKDVSNEPKKYKLVKKEEVVDLDLIDY